MVDERQRDEGHRRGHGPVKVRALRRDRSWLARIRLALGTGQAVEGLEFPGIM